MGDNGRWRLTDVQRSLVVLAVITAMFLSAMSLGMQNVALLLVALLLLVCAGLGVFMLGLRHNGREGIQGTAHVIMVQPPPDDKIVGRCDMRLLVEMPGRPSTMVKLRDPSVHVIKWPRVGMILPVEVSATNMRQLRVRWELVAAHSRTSSPAEEAAAFAVPFFTDYASDTPPRGDESATDEASPLNDAPPPPAAVALDENFPPAPGPEADPEGTILTGTIVVRERNAEAKARAAQYELPMRTIPQPRPPERPTQPPADRAPLGDPEAHAMGMMLIVSDLQRSLRFYVDLLECAVVDSTSGSAVLSHGGGRILLRQVADMSPVDRRVVHLHLQVSDVETAYQDLRAKGAEFVHRPRMMSRGDRLELWAATFRDPDGHAIALTQWRDREESPPP